MPSGWRWCRRLAAMVLVLIVFSSCRLPLQREEIPPVKDFRNYPFSTTTPLPDRVAPAPPFVLRALQQMDHKDSYTPYLPTESERRQLAAGLELLPPSYRKLLTERLLAIYFINDFQGSGLTDYVRAPDGSLYTFMVLNPQVLRTGISDWLTRREESCFREDGSGTTLSVHVGDRFTGLMYILLHETTHVVDYVKGITPYVEPELKRADRSPAESPSTNGIWADYRRPVAPFDFAQRDRVSFYGLDHGPKLDKKSAADLYPRLLETPFVSLYGSQNWAEDLAELLTFYHLTVTYGEPYRITVATPAGTLLTVEPFRNPLVIQRLGQLSLE